MKYNLEEAVSLRSAAYRQIYKYYDFCEHVRLMSPATLASKVYVINDFLRYSQLSDLRKITNQIIYGWISAQQQRGNAGRSINDRLAHLKAMLRWQQAMNVAMPKLKLSLIPKVNEQPPRKVFFTRQEIERVLREANEVEWLLIRLAFDCGLRIGEIRSLRMRHIHNDCITIIGKGSKRRYVYISREVRNRLTEWIGSHNIIDYLWPSSIYAGRPLSICTVRNYMQQAFQRCGYADFCPHDLRHSYATDLKLLGLPTRYIQAGLGHATEAVTERYLSDLEDFNLRQLYEIKYTQHPVENYQNI